MVVSRQMNKKKRKILIIVGIVFAVGVLVAMLGRVMFYNEFRRDVVEQAFLGYVNEEKYIGEQLFTRNQLPEWCQRTQMELLEDGAQQEPDEFSVRCTVEKPRVGIYADVTYLEYRCEDRRWIDGKLMTSETEYYYKVREHIQLRACSEGMIPDIPLKDLRVENYGRGLSDRG